MKFLGEWEFWLVVGIVTVATSVAVAAVMRLAQGPTTETVMRMHVSTQYEIISRLNAHDKKISDALEFMAKNTCVKHDVPKENDE